MFQMSLEFIIQNTELVLFAMVAIVSVVAYFKVIRYLVGFIGALVGSYLVLMVLNFLDVEAVASVYVWMTKLFYLGFASLGECIDLVVNRQQIVTKLNDIGFSKTVSSMALFSLMKVFVLAVIVFKLVAYFIHTRKSSFILSFESSSTPIENESKDITSLYKEFAVLRL